MWLNNTVDEDIPRLTSCYVLQQKGQGNAL